MQLPEPSPVSSDSHVTTKRPSASAVTEGLLLITRRRRVDDEILSDAFDGHGRLL